MANISRSALQLLKDLIDSGTHPLDYMSQVEDELHLADPRKPRWEYTPLKPGAPHWQQELALHTTEPDRIGRQMNQEELAKLLGEENYGTAPYDLSKAIEAYTGSNYQGINRALRSRTYSPDNTAMRRMVPGAPDVWYSPASKKEIAQKIKEGWPTELAYARRLASSFYPAPVDTVVYRGISPASRTLAAHGWDRSRGRRNLFDDYGNEGFMSTSTSKGVGENFGEGVGGLFRILVPEGAPIRPVLNTSAHAAEYEVMLPPRSVYTRLGDPDDWGATPLMWAGRGKPESGKYIGAALPFMPLLNKYGPQDDSQ